ncbi:MAG: patatin-like phospholipase family protein [Parachlamydiaceae bacterium]|nr:patatin-like phospholipase family protein [Parachlamydiaceae bacterium]
MKYRIILRFLAALTLVTSVGCSTYHYYPSDSPPPLPHCVEIKKPIRLVLVLGGGGARGIAHVGVLEELEKANIPIDVVVGSSAGSIVGALYADGESTEHLKEVFLSLKSNYLMDLNLFACRYGLCQGRTLRRFLENNLDATTFEELKIPFYAVSTDLYSGELVPIGGGPIVAAIEASAAIPFIFTPVSLHGRVLVDGGVIDPCPVRVAKHFGADIIVAVELCNLLPPRLPSNLFGVACRSLEITFLWQSEDCISTADVVISPELGEVGCFDDKYHEAIYQAGREAAIKMIPKIQDLLAKKAKEHEKVSYEKTRLTNGEENSTKNGEDDSSDNLIQKPEH